MGLAHVRFWARDSIPYSIFCACEDGSSREAILGRLARSWWIADLEDMLVRNMKSGWLF